MKIGGRQAVSQFNRYNEFGGGSKPYYTSNCMPLMPDVGVYRAGGTGRDTYISYSNGNNFLGYHPDK